MWWTTVLLCSPLLLEAAAYVNQIPFSSDSLLDTQLPACAGQFKSYTALGDSYAAGLGSSQELPVCSNGTNNQPDCTSRRCRKNSGAYSYRFWKENQISQFQYLPCEGADANWVRDEQVDTDSFGDPDLVTISVGGDESVPAGGDSFFNNIVMKCIFTLWFNSKECDEAIQLGFDTEAKVSSKLDDLFKKIDARTKSGTKVVVMSYVLFWGSGSCILPWSYPDANQKGRMNTLATKLNADLKDAVDNVNQRSGRNANFYYANVDATWDGHRYCDTNWPWFQTYTKTSFHPTADGQQAYLNVLKQTLGCV